MEIIHVKLCCYYKHKSHTSVMNLLILQTEHFKCTMLTGTKCNNVQYSFLLSVKYIGIVLDFDLKHPASVSKHFWSPICFIIIFANLQKHPLCQFSSSSKPRFVRISENDAIPWRDLLLLILFAYRRTRCLILSYCSSWGNLLFTGSVFISSLCHLHLEVAMGSSCLTFRPRWTSQPPPPSLNARQEGQRNVQIDDWQGPLSSPVWSFTHHNPVGLASYLAGSPPRVHGDRLSSA